MPKVSVYVPVYGTEALLPRALDCLVHQTLKDIEIIVVNDGSPGNCNELVEEYRKKDSRIRLLKRSENLGTYAATLDAMLASSGQYLARLDPDDTLQPHALETAYIAALSNNADICYYSSNWIYSNDYLGKKMRPYSGEGVFNQEETIRLFLTFNKRKKSVLYCVWGFIIKREIAQKIGVSLPSLRLVMAEDLLQHLAFLTEVKKTTMIPDRLYNYHLNAGVTSKKTFKQWFSSTKDITTSLKYGQKILFSKIDKKELRCRFRYLCFMEYLFLLKKLLYTFKK